MKYRGSWHEAEVSKFSASRQPGGETSASRTTSLSIPTGTDRLTDRRRTPDRYITLSASRGHRNKYNVLYRSSLYGGRVSRDIFDI